MYRELSYKVKEYELLCSLISANELVTWADNIILNEDDLDEIIIGLSLTNNAKKQYGILSNLSTKHESKAFSIVTNKIAKLYENNILGFYEISNKLISMNYHSINLNNHQVDFCNWLEDETYLIAEGYKDLSSANVELREFLISEKHAVKTSINNLIL